MKKATNMQIILGFSINDLRIEKEEFPSRPADEHTCFCTLLMPDQIILRTAGCTPKACISNRSYLHLHYIMAVHQLQPQHHPFQLIQLLYHYQTDGFCS